MRSSCVCSRRKCLTLPIGRSRSSSRGERTTRSGGWATTLSCAFPALLGRRGRLNSKHSWLPRLAPYLPVAVPEPLAIGEPCDGYPYRWAVHRWIPGEGAALDRIDDPVAFALDVAGFIRRLQAVPTDGAPPPKNRARSVHEYDDATRLAIERAGHLIDACAALAVWEEALAAPSYAGAPVWVQGDLDGNCLTSYRALVRRRRLGFFVRQVTQPWTFRSCGRHSSRANRAAPSSTISESTTRHSRAVVELRSIRRVLPCRTT